MSVPLPDDHLSRCGRPSLPDYEDVRSRCFCRRLASLFSLVRSSVSQAMLSPPEIPETPKVGLNNGRKLGAGAKEGNGGMGER
jgi:hypothetical protein